jgi:hypothetical protein
MHAVVGDQVYPTRTQAISAAILKIAVGPSAFLSWCEREDSACLMDMPYVPMGGTSICWGSEGGLLR